MVARARVTKQPRKTRKDRFPMSFVSFIYLCVYTTTHVFVSIYMCLTEWAKRLFRVAMDNDVQGRFT